MSHAANPGPGVVHTEWAGYADRLAPDGERKVA